MKFAIGVACVVLGYALFYQGVYMNQKYDPKTGTLPKATTPPLGALLGFTTYTAKDAERDVKERGSTKPPVDVQPPFVWGQR